MAGTARLWGPWTEVTSNNGRVRGYGSKMTDAPKSISLSQEAYHTTATVADNYTKVTLWQNGDGGLDTFDVLLFESDADVLLELVEDRTGSPLYSTINVTANNPVRLTADDIVNVASSSGGATTTDVIDEISVQRNVADGVGDANVELVLLD